jgi:hypothetical protein
MKRPKTKQIPFSSVDEEHPIPLNCNHDIYFSRDTHITPLSIVEVDHHVSPSCNAAVSEMNPPD